MWVIIWLCARHSLGLPFSADGMFAILLPSTLAPLVAALVYGELKAKQLGLVAQSRHQGMSLCSANSRSSFTPPKATGLPSRR